MDDDDLDSFKDEDEDEPADERGGDGEGGGEGEGGGGEGEGGEGEGEEEFFDAMSDADNNQNAPLPLPLPSSDDKDNSHNNTNKQPPTASSSLDPLTRTVVHRAQGVSNYTQDEKHARRAGQDQDQEQDQDGRSTTTDEDGGEGDDDDDDDDSDTVDSTKSGSSPGASTSSNSTPPTVSTSTLALDAFDHMKQKTKNWFKKLTVSLGKSPEVVPFRTASPSTASSGGEEDTSVEEDTTDSAAYIKVHVHQKHRGEFSRLRQVQELAGHDGSVWALKFSDDGRFLATGGRDSVLRIWTLVSESDAGSRERTAGVPVVVADDSASGSSQTAIRAAPEGSHADAANDGGLSSIFLSSIQKSNDSDEERLQQEPEEEEQEQAATEPSATGGARSLALFSSKPYRELRGHEADILDISWAKTNFILSSSLDRTVRLWHVTVNECLCCFQHTDFVTAVAFHPQDDRFFLSGSLDAKVRLWNIAEKHVAYWNQLPNEALITAAGFARNGQLVGVGTFSGVCHFFETQGLRYNTQLHVRSTRGRNKKGKKITGIEPHPREDKVLISSNDSRMRCYYMDDRSLFCKYKGHVNMNSQIHGSYSDDGEYIVSGSEDHRIYLWNANLPLASESSSLFGTSRRDRNESYEYFDAHENVVTVVRFAPKKLQSLLEEKKLRPAKRSSSSSNRAQGKIFASADYAGIIKIFENERPKYRVKSLSPVSTKKLFHDEQAQAPANSETNDAGRKRSASIGTSNVEPSSAARHHRSLSNPVNSFFRTKDRKNTPSIDPNETCASCGGNNLKCFFMSSGSSDKKSKDTFIVCLDCNLSWKS